MTKPTELEWSEDVDTCVADWTLGRITGSGIDREIGVHEWSAALDRPPGYPQFWVIFEPNVDDMEQGKRLAEALAQAARDFFEAEAAR